MSSSFRLLLVIQAYRDLSNDEEEFFELYPEFVVKKRIAEKIGEPAEERGLAADVEPPRTQKSHERVLERGVIGTPIVFGVGSILYALHHFPCRVKPTSYLVLNRSHWAPVERPCSQIRVRGERVLTPWSHVMTDHICLPTSGKSLKHSE